MTPLEEHGWAVFYYPPGTDWDKPLVFSYARETSNVGRGASMTPLEALEQIAANERADQGNLPDIAAEALPLARAQAEELETLRNARDSETVTSLIAAADERDALKAQLSRQAAVIEAAKELVTAQYEDEIEQSLDHLKDALDALSSDEGGTE